LFNTNTVDDYRGRPVVSSPFTSNQFAGSIRVNGNVTSSYNVGIAVKTVFRDLPMSVNSSGLTTSVLPAPSGWTLDLVAGTNPNKPVISPLMLLQDLVQLPKMIRDLGRLVTKPKRLMTPQETASYYLGAQFGWLPLFEDVRKLFDLQAHIEKKINELYKLQSGRGLRRRLKMGDDTQNAKGIEVWPLYGPSNFVNFNYDVTVKRRRWATIKWKPSSLPSRRLNDAEISSRARRIVLGLTYAGMLQGAWELIPWTWVINWFTNVSKFAIANANTVPVVSSDMCFMSESKRIYIARPITSQGAKDSTLRATGAFTATTKTRIVSSVVTAGFNVPFLDTFRLSILGALFTQRLKR
jgi:hypothetical protein